LPYHDADVRHKISFDSEWAINEPLGKLPDLDANNMHEAVVEELIKKLEAGEKFEKKYWGEED